MPAKLTPSDCASRLKALADPDRLRIISFLQLGSFAVSEIAQELDLEVANASHHLGVLKASGIVTCEKKGRSRIYQLRPELNALAKPGHLDFGCCQFQLKKLS